MPRLSKGKSPFYPGQPVPVDLFVGRAEQIDYIMDRGVRQVEAGKPVAMYVQGEYGIGKSSFASYCQTWAEREHGLYGIYTSLGAAESLDNVGEAILEATVRSGAFNPTRAEKIRDWLAKYIGEQSIAGVITLHADALQRDAPNIASGILPFLTEALNKLSDTGVRGIFLVLDEINGITANPKFAHFIKALVDTNAVADRPLPLLLMLCGVEERRREMIRHHQPVDRIFDIVEIEAMSEKEMKAFFQKAFKSAAIRVEPGAMDVLIEHSAGFPKIMHLIGDSAFWLDRDGVITADEAIDAVIDAAEQVGKKYVDQQVYKALRSRDYHSILRKIGQLGWDMRFQRVEVGKRLKGTERKKFSNFLQKMKKLRVIRSGDVQGEYIFNSPMVRIYIWLDSLERKKD